MLIVIWGEDQFRSLRFLKKLLGKEKGSISVFDFLEPELKLTDIINEFRTSSLFQQKSILVIKNLFKEAKENEIKTLFDFLKDLETNVEELIFFEGQGEIKNLTYFKQLLKKADKNYQFFSLTKSEASKYIKELEKEFNLTLPLSLREAILESGLLESGLIYQLFEKMSLLSFKEFKASEIEELFNWPVSEKIYKLIDACLLGERAKAFRLLHSEISRGEAPLKIFNLLTYEVRQLISYKEAPKEVSSGLKNKFRLYYLKRLAQQYPLEKLKKIYSQLAVCDYKIKVGQIEPTLALELVLGYFFN